MHSSAPLRIFISDIVKEAELEGNFLKKVSLKLLSKTFEEEKRIRRFCK